MTQLKEECLEVSETVPGKGQGMEGLLRVVVLGSWVKYPPSTVLLRMLHFINLAIYSSMFTID